MEDGHTTRWQRINREESGVGEMGGDPIYLLRKQIAEVRAAPRKFEPRRRLRAMAADLGAWEPLAMLLADEASAADGGGRPDVAAAFFEELADCYENLDQPNDTIAAMQAVVALAPGNVSHHERLAWLFRRAGKWAEAATEYLKVGELGGDEAAYKALRAAARIYRDRGRPVEAADAYRRIVSKRPNDLDAWRALDELYGEMKRWDELALVREELAARTDDAVDRAALVRAQARALTEAGDVQRATGLVEQIEREVSGKVREVSGIVDQVAVLAQLGRGREAAELLRTRLAATLATGGAGAGAATGGVRDRADADEIASLRARLAAVLEDACGDRPASAAVLEELLRDAPAHLGALERLVWQASHDPDPRVHARALVRQANALKPGVAKREAMLEAARRFREGGDHRSAVSAYEQAVAMAGGEGLREELAAAKATLAVELARADSASGDVASAERRLRAILERSRGDLDANLALAELLQSTGRLAEARAAMTAALVETPDEAPPEQLAQLVYRHALVCAALGEHDEAHQMLHEAHHLARRDLPITLALGESCFARKLWREATIHLGGLADHPEAGRHAAAVATGLAKAAAAEVRCLRPQNAEKHLRSALALDAACAPALHALAEIAIERADVAGAAGLLEREARATVDPEKQLRLWDALGDLAEGMLGDRARAARCWEAVVALPLVGDAAIARVPVLDKLIALQRETASPALGETCMALAAAIAATPAATSTAGTSAARAAQERWRDLVVEAIGAFAAVGDLVRARDAAERAMEKWPADASAVEAASAVAIALGDMAAAKTWLRPALAAWDARAATAAAAPPGSTSASAPGASASAVAARSSAASPASPAAARSSAASAGSVGIDRATHAELWRRLGDAERARANEKAALAAYQRAVNVAPESPGALAARRGLVDLAAGGASGGMSVATSLAALVEAEHDPREAIALARGLAARTAGKVDDNIEDARAAYELAIALGVALEPSDRAFLAQHAGRTLAADEAYGAALDDEDHRALIDDAADAPIGELSALLWEVAAQLAPSPQSALFEADRADAKRLAAASDAAAAAMLPQIAKLLGGPPVLVHVAPRGAGTGGAGGAGAGGAGGAGAADRAARSDVDLEVHGRRRADRDGNGGHRAAATERDVSHADALGGLARLAYEDLAAPTRPPLRDLVEVLFASPPVVVIGAQLAQPRARTVAEDDLERDRDAELRFVLGRAIELTRPRRIFAAQGADGLGRLLAAVVAAFGPAAGSAVTAAVDPSVAREAERLRGAMSVALRKRVADFLAPLPPLRAAPRGLDAIAFIAACERAADRAGLVACGRVDVAVAAAGGAERAEHLVTFASTQRYLAIRRKLRARR